MLIRLFAAMSAACAVLSSFSTGALAYQRSDLIPSPESGPAVTDLEKVGKNWELRDVIDGTLIMQQRNALPLVAPIDPEVTATVELREQPAGYDMVVTFTNDTDRALRPGQMYAGIFTLGPDIEWIDVRHSTRFRHASFDTYVGRGYTYPDDLFSPIYVIRNGKYAVGVSVRYPAIEYEHDVRVATMNPKGGNAGEGGPGWGAGVRFANPDNVSSAQKIRHPGIIPPKSTRTYVLCVRVARGPENWMYTLIPYARYFRETYGGVTYDRWTGLVLPVGIADSYYQEAGNLDGFGDPNIRRPDVFGWGPWAERLSAIKGCQAVMLWAPSGLYFHNPQYNYPFQMTSRWMENPVMNDAIDPAIGLPRVGNSGKQLGLWWGRSLDISRSWDPTEVEPLDPENPDHVALARRELDIAVQAGVTLVGMDTFNPSINSLHRAYKWMRYLRQNYSTIHFMAEPSPCDILMTLVGGVIPGWTTEMIPKVYEDLYQYNTPHYLADLLVPGHELVMSYRYNNHQEFFGINVTPETVDADGRKFAAMGFAPMMWAEVETLGDVAAARTWEWTVPSDLRYLIEHSEGDADHSGSDQSGDSTSESNGGEARPR
jgi:hypothetical protein